MQLKLNLNSQHFYSRNVLCFLTHVWWNLGLSDIREGSRSGITEGGIQLDGFPFTQSEAKQKLIQWRNRAQCRFDTCPALPCSEGDYSWKRKAKRKQGTCFFPRQNTILTFNCSFLQLDCVKRKWNSWSCLVLEARYWCFLLPVSSVMLLGWSPPTPTFLGQFKVTWRPDDVRSCGCPKQICLLQRALHKVSFWRVRDVHSGVESFSRSIINPSPQTNVLVHPHY